MLSLRYEVSGPVRHRWDCSAMSLFSSMVEEGTYENRGLLRESTSVRLLIFLALPGSDICMT